MTKCDAKFALDNTVVASNASRVQKNSGIFYAIF